MFPEFPVWTQPAAERKRRVLASFGTVVITVLSAAIGKLLRDRTSTVPYRTCYLIRVPLVEDVEPHPPMDFQRLSPVLFAQATHFDSPSQMTAEEDRVWSGLRSGHQNLLEHASSQPHLFRILSQLEAMAGTPMALDVALETRILDGLSQELQTALFSTQGDRENPKLRSACRRMLQFTLTQARALDRRGKRAP